MESTRSNLERYQEMLNEHESLEQEFNKALDKFYAAVHGEERLVGHYLSLGRIYKDYGDKLTAFREKYPELS